MAAPATFSIAPLTFLVAPTTFSVAPLMFSIAPTTFSVAPLMFLIAPSPLTVAPTMFSFAPITYLVAPAFFLVAPLMFLSQLFQKKFNKSKKESLLIPSLLADFLIHDLNKYLFPQIRAMTKFEVHGKLCSNAICKETDKNTTLSCILKRKCLKAWYIF
jgi:hypothetical protein